MASAAEMVNELAERYHAAVGDPLGAVARRERRALLGASVIGIGVVKAGIIPTKIPAFGVEFSPGDQSALLKLSAFVILYLLVAFVIYAVSDLAASYSRIKSVEAVLAAANKEHELFLERLYELEKFQIAMHDAGTYSSERQEAVEASRRSTLALQEGVNRFRKSVAAGWGSRIGKIRLALVEFGIPVVLSVYAVVILWQWKLPSN